VSTKTRWVDHAHTDGLQPKLCLSHISASTPSFKPPNFLSAMRSYTTILVLALAVSNVSPALSAPVLYGGLRL